LVACATGHVPVHGGSSSIFERIAAHAPNQSGRGRRTAVKFYALRDNLPDGALSSHTALRPRAGSSVRPAPRAEVHGRAAPACRWPVLFGRRAGSSLRATVFSSVDIVLSTMLSWRARPWVAGCRPLRNHRGIEERQR
jgi:hypothetical protein